MNRTETEYLERYKELDSLCRQRLNVKNGVSEYIQTMEIRKQGQDSVKEWKEDYKLLKHLRWLRNNIAHSTEQSDCKPEDLKNLKEFIGRMEKKSDPLGKLERNQQRKLRQKARKSENLTNFIIGFIALVLMIGLIWFLKHKTGQ